MVLPWRSHFLLKLRAFALEFRKFLQDFVPVFLLRFDPALEFAHFLLQAFDLVELPSELFAQWNARIPFRFQQINFGNSFDDLRALRLQYLLQLNEPGFEGGQVGPSFGR